MNLRKAAEMALEIIEGEWPADDEIASPVMYALREALAQPEQDPVAYRTVNNVGAYVYHSADRLPNEYGLRGEALYLHPAPIPEGWQLVPKKPTKEMSDTFWSAYIPAPDGIAQSYRVIEEKVDPYAELKAAAKDPTKQIRCGGAWADAGTLWAWNRPVWKYEIRNKPTKMKLRAWVYLKSGNLTWKKEGHSLPSEWKRVPSEDKEIEVEE